MRADRSAAAALALRLARNRTAPLSLFSIDFTDDLFIEFNLTAIFDLEFERDKSL